MISTSRKVAGEIGISAQALYEYRFAAELTGVDSRTLDLALLRVKARIDEAAQGRGELKNTLRKYDIAIHDVRGWRRGMADVIDDYAEAVKNVESDTERLRLVVSAFGSDAALVVMFKQGRAGMAAVREELRKSTSWWAICSGILRRICGRHE